MFIWVFIYYLDYELLLLERLLESDSSEDEELDELLLLEFDDELDPDDEESLIEPLSDKDLFSFLPPAVILSFNFDYFGFFSKREGLSPKPSS